MAAKAEKFNLMDLLNQRSKQKQEAEEQHPAAEGIQEERTEENKQQGNNVFMVDAYNRQQNNDKGKFNGSKKHDRILEWLGCKT